MGGWGFENLRAVSRGQPNPDDFLSPSAATYFRIFSSSCGDRILQKSGREGVCDIRKGCSTSICCPHQLAVVDRLTVKRPGSPANCV